MPYCKSDSEINQVILRLNLTVFDSTLAKKYAALNKEKTLKAGVETLAFSLCKKCRNDGGECEVCDMSHTIYRRIW